ncbi:MAG: hypothetical protein ACRDCB_12660 [Clostridium sp.]|uniref:hypothetical protein n=1 Tax=Clostridium chrysemydis TaxID=2665504 RepID=UPI003EE74487
MNNFKLNKGIIFAILIFIVIVVVGSFIIRSTGGKVKELLFNDSKFKYSTSDTSKYNSKSKSDYFTTKMTPKDAYDYIKKNCKGFDEAKAVEGEDSFIIRYHDEDVLIYKGDDGTTYVQIADEEYIRDNGFTSTYRRSKWNAASTLILLDLAEGRKGGKGFFSSIFRSSGGGSVRGDSAGGRSTVGGGTSFGK